ncbi:MAG: methyltransferase domain-containing protein [Elusimicrobiota bacterium]
MIQKKFDEEQLLEFYKTSEEYLKRLNKHKDDYFRNYLSLLEPESTDSFFLDVGCGTGYAVLKLAEKGFKGVGIDISPLFIEEAKKIARNYHLEQNVDFVAANVSSIPYPDETFI